ncbi:MAG TPA: beta-N-acetylhexosaminidase [Gammaproteobacteria bacterium]
MSLGPVMVDVQGTSLDDEERELLCHPQVGAVILFSRNYQSPQQVKALIDEIHAVRDPHLLVAVDHEGGRVQRFRSGFAALPAVRLLGELYDHDKKRARHLAEQAGWVMASELRAVGVDFSFAPVLDLDLGRSGVIGNRAFHTQAAAAAELAGAYMLGMRRAGMAATGKHFPGHGYAEADSHLAIPEDDRPLADILQQDVVPYERLIPNGLAAIMPAHVIYSRVDAKPAGFSPFWLKEILRNRLGFQGVIFSDDLNMEGASVAGDYVARAEAALSAGCDMVLICNNRPAAWQILRGLHHLPEPVSQARLARMHGLHPVTWEELHDSPAWQQAVAAVEQITPSQTLALDL